MPYLVHSLRATAIRKQLIGLIDNKEETIPPLVDKTMTRREPEVLNPLATDRTTVSSTTSHSSYETGEIAFNPDIE